MMNAKCRSDTKRWYGSTKGNNLDNQRSHRNAEGRTGRFPSGSESQAVALGESKPEDSSSAAGAMHRAWINLKSAIAKRDDHAILAECERGEDSAVKEYREAIEEENLAAPVREIISRQYAEVQSAHDRIKLFRDTMAT